MTVQPVTTLALGSGPAKIAVLEQTRAVSVERPLSKICKAVFSISEDSSTRRLQAQPTQSGQRDQRKMDHSQPLGGHSGLSSYGAADRDAWRQTRKHITGRKGNMHFIRTASCSCSHGDSYSALWGRFAVTAIGARSTGGFF